MEVVTAHFGLLPGFAKDIKYGLRTHNARTETVAELASFKQAWAQARHCIIPAEAIYEPMGVAGLWNPRKSPSFGSIYSGATNHCRFKL